MVEDKDISTYNFDDYEMKNISDVAWLNSTTEVKYPNSNNTYSVGAADLPNAEYQFCLLPDNSTTGHCRHLVHCVLQSVINKFEDFLPYGQGCVIDARFVGICCPDQKPIPLEVTTLSTNTSADAHTESGDPSTIVHSVSPSIPAASEHPAA